MRWGMPPTDWLMELYGPGGERGGITLRKGRVACERLWLMCDSKGSSGGRSEIEKTHMQGHIEQNSLVLRRLLERLY